MQKTLPNIGLKQIRKLVPSQDILGLGDDFFMIHVRYNDGLQLLKYPCRCDAFIMMFCNAGEVEVEINLNQYKVMENTMLVSAPGNLIRVVPIEKEMADKVNFTVVAISSEYISGLNFDMKKLFNDRLNLLVDPCFLLSGNALSISSRYFRLFRALMESEFEEKREAVGSLIGSFFYSLRGLLNSTQPSKKIFQEEPSATVRMNLVFRHFMELVTEFHTVERGVQFYSSKLGLSPKYLSKLVKQVSGRSAPEWIDSYVILEAKNMLKYTDISIKEIVYSLHFADTSVFHKFFKSHTGMTPSEYRRS